MSGKSKSYGTSVLESIMPIMRKLMINQQAADVANRYDSDSILDALAYMRQHTRCQMMPDAHLNDKVCDKKAVGTVIDSKTRVCRDHAVHMEEKEGFPVKYDAPAIGWYTVNRTDYGDWLSMTNRMDYGSMLSTLFPIEPMPVPSSVVWCNWPEIPPEPKATNGSCPLCGSKAFVMTMSAECTNSTCQNHR